MAGSLDGASYIQLHTRPEPREPEVQITFQAVLVDGHPMIRVELPNAKARGDEAVTPNSTRSVVQIGVGAEPELSGRDPDAACESCGVIGTVGRACRTDPDKGLVEEHRFCAACWPEQSARYRARWKEDDRLETERFFRGKVGARGAGPGMYFESATWHGTLKLVRLIEDQMIAPVPPTPQALAAIANQIAAHQSRFEGEMPFEVEMFIRRYGADDGDAPSADV